MAAEPAPAAVQGVEAEVLEAVWDLGEASVRATMDALNAGIDPPRAYTTYMTTLSRLRREGLLVRGGYGKTDCCRAEYTREEYAGLRARAEVAALVAAFGDVALGH